MWVKKAREAVKIPDDRQPQRGDPCHVAGIRPAARRPGRRRPGAELLRDPAGLRRNRQDTVEEEQLAGRSGKSGAAVKIPIAVKLSVFYSNPLNLISPARTAKAPPASCSSTGSSSPTSTPTRSPSRSLSISASRPTTGCRCDSPGLLHGRIKADVCASTGVMTGADVAKMILAGASSVAGGHRLCTATG